jgi:site-specific DNA-methyltransferase (cytosine-N4-specific)
MHDVLDEAWQEVARVLAPGGIACINVGDATRRLDGEFRLYPNHARVVSALDSLGLSPLPDLLWRKPVNSGTKFMGSGMLPPNAYPTLEHEYVLVVRNGGPRSLEPRADRRYEAAYFWEERNEWFSDVWTDLPGRSQSLPGEDSRDRSGAFPFALPYRLVCMFSVYGDTVLDPFVGTGTTTLAAMVAGRNSVARDRDPDLAATAGEAAAAAPSLSRSVGRDRLAAHRAFVRDRQSDGGRLSYDAEYYDFPVVTKQERRLRLYEVADVESAASEDESVRYELSHEPLAD